ncbi:hypothetical protein GGI07_001979 [Coemansia sp. Benny D115]|nr:hypothetical protein GGI07_001979 [Coemansia sp. Benny D115]
MDPRPTPSAAPPAPSQPLGRLVGALLDPRRLFAEPAQSQSQSQSQSPPPSLPSLPSPAAPLPADAVPEALRPSMQRYSASWDAAQRRHDSSIAKSKLVDDRLGRLLASLQAHDEHASLLARQVASLADVSLRLDSLKIQADALRPALASLDLLYARLAGADADDSTAWAADMAQQESVRRRDLHEHYAHLQHAMDRQYAELRRTAVHARAANAERSFQSDLANYARAQNRDVGTGTSTGTQTLRPGANPLAAWASADAATRDFFSDSDGDGDAKDAEPSVSQSPSPSPSQLQPLPLPPSSSSPPSPPAFAILQDEDFA